MRERFARWLQTLSLWGLAALLIALPLWRHRVLFHRPLEPLFFEFRDITLYTNDLLWWAAVAAWFLSRLLDPTPAKLRWGPWFLSGPLAGLVFLSAVGTPFAVDPLYAGYQTLRLGLLMALYLMVVNLPWKPSHIAWPFAIAMALQAVVSLPQFALGRSLGLAELGEVSVNATWPGTSVVMVGDQRWLRAYGLTQHPNLLGGCLMATILIVTGYYLLRAGWIRLPLLIALGLGSGALLLTFSRAAWLGTLLGGVTMLVLLVWALRHRRWTPSWSSIGLFATLLLVIAVLFGLRYWPLLRPRLGLVSQGVEIRSVDSRVMEIDAVRALVEMRPWLGVGQGNFPTALYELARETVAEYPVYQPVHNVLFLATTELGFVGGALWLGLLVAPWLALWAKRHQLSMGPWWAGLSGALVGLYVVGFFDHYPWSSHQGRLLLWLAWGLWAGEWTHDTKLEKTV